jgi:4-amino-4-deoxy-L-arabinose transferase-like glycosyltransferase
MRPRHVAFTLIIVWIVLLLSTLALYLPLPIDLRSSFALLSLLIPGTVLTWAWLGSESDLLARIFLALSGGFALLLLSAFSFVMLPIQFPPVSFLWFGGLVSALASLSILRTKTNKQAQAVTGLASTTLLLLILLICGAALLRFPTLGSAEFGGDEALVARSAVDALHTDSQALFERRKGPGEALPAVAILALTGHLNEWSARLPFAVASLVTILGCVVLGRSLAIQTGLSQKAADAIGLLAATILALDGLLLGYSRILQYQNLVVLMMSAAFYCAWRFANQADDARRWLLACAITAGLAVLCHYDGALVLPALGWLIIVGAWKQSWPVWRRVTELGLAAIVGSAIILSFYLPFFTGDSAARTNNYLLWRVMGSSGDSVIFDNNLANYYGMITFYNTRFQIIAVVILLVVAVGLWLWNYLRPQRFAHALFGIWLLVCAIQLINPSLFIVGRYNLAILAFGLPLAALTLSPFFPQALRGLLLWFSASFVLMSFLMHIPNGHYYTLHVPTALICAWASVQLWQLVSKYRPSVWARAAQYSMGAAAGALLLLTLPYLWLVFQKQEAEFHRSFPASRPAIYRASYGDQLPSGSFLGFPHYDGWKVIGSLYRDGLLDGRYQTNQKTRITRWYIRNNEPNSRPDFYFAALYEPNIIIPEGFHYWGAVESGGRRTLEIYGKEPPKETWDLQSNDYTSQYDEWSLASGWPSLAPRVNQPLRADFDSLIRLRGYGLDTSSIAASGAITMTLQWQTLNPMDEDFTLFIHVLDQNGQPISQVDVPPADPNTPTSTWLAASYETLVQRIPLPVDLPDGDYTLAFGLYRQSDFSRLSIQMLESYPEVIQSPEQALIIGPLQIRVE